MTTPPGCLFNIGDRRLHVSEEGVGTPVVLEAGLAATSLSWCLVQPLIARFARVIAYDRAGLGWSDPSSKPATALNAAQDLARLLDALALNEPVVMVGHSFGGLVARIFEQRSPERVAGLVLVDPVCRAEWRDADSARLRCLWHGVRLSQRGAILARIGVVGFALRLLLRGEQRFPHMIARASAGRGLDVARRLVGEVRKIPRELWPAIAGHWSRPASFRTMASGLEHLPESVGQIEESRRLGDKPIVVLSAANASPAAIAEHHAEAALSSRGRQEMIGGTGHWIPLDAPDAIAAAVRELCV